MGGLQRDDGTWAYNTHHEPHNIYTSRAWDEFVILVAGTPGQEIQRGLSSAPQNLRMGWAGTTTQINY